MPSLSKVLQPIGQTFPSDRTAAEALAQLTASGAEALLIEKDGSIVGLFGYREALAVYADGSAPVAQYMRRPLPGRNVADSLESGADIMYREDTPVVLMTEDEGPLFRKTSRTVGIVSAYEVLEEIGKTTADTASNKVFAGRKDLGLNVPVSPCQRACPIHQDIAAYVDYVSQGRYLDSWLVIHETNPFPSMLGRLCNHPCETDCKRGWVQGPENAVSIKSLKRFATDYAWARRVKIDWQRAPGNGKRVVIGGGAVATDAAQTSIKTGARKVWMVSIEPADRLPAFGNELVEAREIGLTLHTGVIVNGIKADASGHVSGVEFIRVDETKLEFDPESGKLLINTVQKLPGSEHVIPCRYAIFASGQIMDFPQAQGVPS